jgi:hypothetical protein
MRDLLRSPRDPDRPNEEGLINCAIAAISYPLFETAGRLFK